MHRALYIQELVLQIAELLEKRDQLHLGWTCKVIWSIAATLVWRNTGHVFRYLLPRHVQLLGDNETTIFSPCMNQDDWKTVREYGQHIRSLKLQDDSRHDLGYSPLQAEIAIIEGCPGDHPVLSNLRSLEIELLYIKSFTACTGFIRSASRSLNEFILHLPSQEGFMLNWGSVRGFLEALRDSCNLRVLSMSFPMELEEVILLQALRMLPEESEELPDLDFTLGSVLSASPLQSLTTLCLIGLYGAKLVSEAAASLQHLERLELSFHRPITLGMFTLPSGAFPSLKILIIEWSYLDVSFLGSISSDEVSKIEFSCFIASAPAIIQIMGHKWRYSIRQITLRLFQDARDVVEMQLTDVLRPLRPCTLLQEFHIYSGFPFATSDSHIELISSSLPALCRFTFCVPATLGAELTWLSLAFLAARCPRLDYVFIAANLDARVDPFLAQKLTYTPSTSLRTLNAAWSKCSRPGSAVAWLRATFPSLKVFLSSDYHGMKAVRDMMNLPMSS